MSENYQNLDVTHVLSPYPPACLDDISHLRNSLVVDSVQSSVLEYGGFLEPLSASDLLSRHEANPSSCYHILSQDSDLIAFARTSITSGSSNVDQRALIHMICVNRGAIGISLSTRRFADSLMQSVIEYEENRGTICLTASILLYPAFNLASWRLLIRTGFVPESLERTSMRGRELTFLNLVRVKLHPSMCGPTSSWSAPIDEDILG